MLGFLSILVEVSAAICQFTDSGHGRNGTLGC
jgi:hypothetical protein